MNFLRFALLTAVLFIGPGCEVSTEEINDSNKKWYNDNTYVHEIKGCEYLATMGAGAASLTHKGNCKFCEARLALTIQKAVVELRQRQDNPQRR